MFSENIPIVDVTVYGLGNLIMFCKTMDSSVFILLAKTMMKLDLNRHLQHAQVYLQKECASCLNCSTHSLYLPIADSCARPQETA